MKCYKKIFLLLIILVAIPTLLVTLLTAISVRGALIKSVDGAVMIQRANKQEWRPAETGMRFYQGEVIKTGDRSRVVIQLDDGSIIQVASLARITLGQLFELQRGENASIDAAAGKGWMRTKKPAENTDSFSVTSRTAVVGLHGTYFSPGIE